MKRIEYLDFLRGIAIITVVMGHILQFNVSGIAADKCFNFIYSFHMGFFFFISGCTAYLSSHKHEWGKLIPFMRKKSVRLLLPFFIWGGVLFIFSNRLSPTIWIERFLTILRYPDKDAPWFIFELFFIQLIYFICCSMASKRKILLWVLFILSLIISVAFEKVVLRGNCEGFVWLHYFYLLMFFLGHVSQSLNWRVQTLKPTIFICFIIFLLTGTQYDNSNPGLTATLLKTIASISFSLATYLIIRKEYSRLKTGVTRIGEMLGTHTLEIYLTHFCIIRIFNHQWIDVGTMNSVPCFIIVLLLSVPISIMVIYISDVLKKIPYISIFLYGKKNE